MFFAFFLQLSEEWLWISGLIHSVLAFVEITEFSIFIIAPAFYLFAKYQNRLNFDWKDLLHFTPAILVIGNFLPLYISDSTVKLSYVLDKLDLSTFYAHVYDSESLLFLSEKFLDFLNVIQIGIYIFLSIPFFKAIPQNKAKKLEHAYVNWFKTLIWIALLAVFCVILDILFIDTKFDSFSIVYLTSISAFVSYYLIKNSFFFQDNFRTKSYNALSDNEVENIVEAVKNYLQKDHMFLEKKLSLGSTAESIGIPKNKIQFAFDKMSLSFKDELNFLRIQKAKELIQQENSFTLEAIGGEVGYSSKATFYKYFKQFEKITPSEYLKNLV